MVTACQDRSNLFRLQVPVTGRPTRFFMKKRPLSLLAACALASAWPAMAQDQPATPPSIPAPVPDAPAVATPTPEPVKMDAEKVADSPETPRGEAPSPVSATTSESEAAASAAEPTPPAVELPEPTPPPPPDVETTAEPTPPPADADYLPEPTDAGLGTPVEDLPADGDLPNPDSLIPDDATGAASEDLPPVAPTIKENKYDQDRRLAVRYQEVKLQVLKDPAIRSLREQADAAKTDEGKRQAMRAYYRMLFDKMVAVDGALKDKCETMQLAYLRRLGQYKVAPTIPLHPPTTPAPLVN